VLNALKKIFPGVVKPKSAMPDTILQHVRYPQDLFDVQRSLLEQYHVDDPVTFYNVRDKWTVPPDPNDPAAGDQPPYFILAQEPTGGGTEFQLTSPMLVNNSSNLAAYISADSDPDNYGRITVLRVTNSGVIQGPGQIANDFKSKDVISKDISLLNQGGSSVIHGNLLTLPITTSKQGSALQGTFLYVEPLYVQATFTTLQRVLVYYGGQIGYGTTLSNAMSDLQPGHSTGESINLPGSSNGNPTSTPSATPTATPTGTPSGSSSAPSSKDALLAQINATLNDLQSAYKAGDFQRIGADQAKLQQLLQQYESKYGSPSPTPSATR